jgi:hypothetical protein
MAKAKLSWLAFDVSTLSPKAQAALKAIHNHKANKPKAVVEYYEEGKRLEGAFEGMFFKEAEASGANISPETTAFGYNYGGFVVAEKAPPASKKPAFGFGKAKA